MTIKQIKAGFDNFSYITYDSLSKEAAIVDPSVSITKQVEFLKEKELSLNYIINTHHHSDHTNKNRKLRDMYPEAKIIVADSKEKRLDSEIYLKVSEDKELKIGEVTLKFMITPGHTPDGLCIIVDNKAIITGDTLFIDDCGRADLSGGNIKDLFNSLQRIKQLPNNMIIYPGHDYGSKPVDSLENQKRTNKTLLAKDIKEFLKV